MKSKSQSVYFPILGLLAVLAVVGFQAAGRRSSASLGPELLESNSMPNLAGPDAKRYLRERGLDGSLEAAISGVKYSVRTVSGSDSADLMMAENLRQKFASYFSANGSKLIARSPGEDWEFSLRLKGLARAHQQWPVTAGAWSADKTSVSASHTVESSISKLGLQISEVFENRPDGLEQSFVVQTRPDIGGASSDVPQNQTRVVLAASGDLDPRVSDDGQAIVFMRNGTAVLRYDKLKSWDANGKNLDSRMEVNGDEISLVVEDEDAVYPITIDPTFTQVRKIVASDGSADDLFGRSIALSGDIAIVGAISDDIGPNANRGSAYIFSRNAGGDNNWSEVKKLTASDGGANDGFGSAVAIYGDTAIVGAEGDVVVGQGSAYIFDRNAGGVNNWGQVKKLSPSDGVYFGTSLSVDQNTLVVGARGFFDGETGTQGGAYIFERDQGGADNWGLVKRIQASDGGIGDFFGSSSCIKEDTVFIGTGRTRAYVFERDEGGIDNWGQLKILFSQQGSLDVAFATSISVDGETAVVGAPNDFEGDNDDLQGAAYVFGRNAGGENNWGLVKRIVAADGAASDLFGNSVAVSGERIVVGSLGDDVGANADQGSAYVFERHAGGPDNWGLIRKLVAADAAPADRLGIAVAFENKTALLGTVKFGPGTQGPDAVYVFVQTNDSWVETVKPLPGNCTVEDYFGEAVAISGDTAIIAAQGDDVGSYANQGAAYIFERTGTSWNLVKTIAASDGIANDFFGSSVALSGDTAIVGAYSNDVGPNANQGSAYVFVRNAGGVNNWGQVKQLTASDGSAEDWFGWSVGIDGDSIIVGAFLDDVGGNNVQGSAYIYERNSGGTNNWGEVKHLFASDGAALDNFGSAVAVSGDTVVVSSFLDDVGANGNQGSVYIYERNNGGAGNWGEIRKVTASDGAPGDEFGVAVAIDANSLIVGAFTDDTGSNNNQGSAYVFDRNTGGPNNWGQVKKLIASDGAAGDYFGVSVGISGDAAIVGSQSDQIGSNDYQGSAYVFRQNTGGSNNWGQVNKITAADGEAQDSFGSDVAISGDTSIVGAGYDDVGGGINQGSARIFVSGGDTWNQQAMLAPLPEPSCGANDEYGTAVAISGDTAVIGAPADDVGINLNQGSAYVLERNAGGPDNWGVVKLLTASDGEPDEFFGGSVAISGDKVVIGASNDTIGTDTQRGSAYIYERNNGGPDNWGEVKKIVALDGAEDDLFGNAVSISNNIVVVGSIYSGGGTIGNGAAYVFSQNAGGGNNWGQIKKLVAPDGADSDFFGISVAVSGDSVVIGATEADVSVDGQGAAYVFERSLGGPSNWGLAKKLVAADAAAADNFGRSVAIDGNNLVVGAEQDDTGAENNHGSAYIFERNAGGAQNWGQTKKLGASDAAANDRFGQSVSIDGDAVIVGAPFEDIAGGTDQGSAYIFSQNAGGGDNWGQVAKLLGGSGGNGDFFGYSVAVSGDNFLAGAYQATVPTPVSYKAVGGIVNGAAYVFRASAFSPSAAEVAISGRVLTAGGAGIRNARLTLVAPNGETRSALTSSFGFYRFDDVPVGATYVISISAKRYSFSPRSIVVTVSDKISDVDFTAVPQK